MICPQAEQPQGAQVRWKLLATVAVMAEAGVAAIASMAAPVVKHGQRLLEQRRRWLLNVVDEFTREALVRHVDRSITADQTITVLERLVAARGAPRHIRCDTARR